MSSVVIVACLLLGLFPVQTAAQDESELDALEEKVSHHLETKLPGWKHKRVEPIQGSKGVLIESWSFPYRGAKISIVPVKSGEEARERLQSFAKDTREAKQVQGVGDEAFSWGYQESNLVLRRGRYICFVTSGADMDSDPDVRMLSQPERRNREDLEVKRLNKEFAKYLADVVDLL
jgi:hypothetical protein